MEKKANVKPIFYKVLSVLSNVFLILVVGIWLFKRAPKIYEAYWLENRIAPIFNLIDLDGKALSIPEESKKTILVFWATWCGPCQLELARLNKLIEGKAIDAKSVVAISMNEDLRLLQKTAKDRNYLFRLADDNLGEASSYFRVVGTPTVVFLDHNRKIKWVTSGISPTLEARARGFVGATN